MYFHTTRNVEQMDLPFHPTVAQYRAYLAHYGVTVPSRLRKDDLAALALDVRYSDVEVVEAMVAKWGGTIAPVVVPCRNCGEPIHPGYEHCRSCLDAMAARDDAWRAHMNPPVEVVEAPAVPVADDDHRPVLAVADVEVEHVEVAPVPVTVVRVGDDRGYFHVHAAGCRDLDRAPYRGASQYDRFEESHGTVRSVVDSFYGPSAGGFYEEAGLDPKTAWEEYVHDFHFAPCLDSLPVS